MVQNKHHPDEICTAFKTASAVKVSMHLSVKHSLKANKTKIKPKGPFTEIKNRSANHVPKKAQATKGELKAVGEMIFSTYEKTCKEKSGQVI